MAQFDDVKLRDKLCDFEHGWGEVINICERTILIQFGGFAILYLKDGRKYSGEKGSRVTLFWDEVKIDAPERPIQHKCFSCKEVIVNPDAYDGLCSMCYHPKTQKEKCEACEWLNGINYERPITLLESFLLNQHHSHDCSKKSSQVASGSVKSSKK